MSPGRWRRRPRAGAKGSDRWGWTGHRALDPEGTSQKWRQQAQRGQLPTQHVSAKSLVLPSAPAVWPGVRVLADWCGAPALEGRRSDLGVPGAWWRSVVLLPSLLPHPCPIHTVCTRELNCDRWWTPPLLHPVGAPRPTSPFGLAGGQPGPSPRDLPEKVSGGQQRPELCVRPAAGPACLQK